MSPVMCMICGWVPQGRPRAHKRALVQHHTLTHEPLPCVEMTCAGMKRDHVMGSENCSYTFDPIQGLEAK